MEPSRQRPAQHRAVVYFTRPTGAPPSLLGSLIREFVTGPTHVAVGDGEVVFDPFLSPPYRFFPETAYKRFMYRYRIGSIEIPTLRPVIGDEQCESIPPLSGAPSSLSWAMRILAGRDCVPTVCSLLRTAGVSLAGDFRVPSSLYRALCRLSME